MATRPALLAGRPRLTAPTQDRAPEVLVVGAGPVGLTAAHELARRGLRVRLVDAAAGPAVTSRAVAVHPRTLETFDQMGMVDSVVARGRRNQAFTMYAAGRRLVRLEADYAGMPTRFPFTLMLEQAGTEAALREAVARLGVEVEWGVRLVDLTHDHRGVTATLTGPDGHEQQCRTAWLVGCDGGHSVVRKRLGLPLLGTSNDTWMLADAQVDFDLPPDTIYWVHTGRQAMMMVPYAQQGRWRLLDTAPPTGAAELTPERIAASFAERLGAGLGRPVGIGAPEWTSVFTFQQRMVPRMREGRVVVAGDAAHVHSPASGQGMNTGIQEAFNLAWKLAMVHRGQARPELLDSYQQERVPVGARLLRSTGHWTFLIQLRNLLAAAALPVVFSVVRTVPALRRRIQRKVLGGISGLLLDYADGPLSTLDEAARGRRRRPVTAPTAGQRAAMACAQEGRGADALREQLRDTRWTLLVAEGGHDRLPLRTGLRAADHYAGWLSVRTLCALRSRAVPGVLTDPDGALRAALALPPGGWALIRPDGYLAARGDRLTPHALENALRPLCLRPALQSVPSEPHADAERIARGSGAAGAA